MTRLAAFLCLMASPLAAESYTFGGSSIEWTGREVIFRNGSTRMAEFPLDFFRDLTNGFTVRVVIMQGVSDAPDTMMVIPPPGYIAVPEMVTVDEFQSGVIVVTMEGLS